MLSDYLRGKKIVLASGSPRRKALLEGLDIEFSVMVPEVSEDYYEGMSNEETAIDLAVRKAKWAVDAESPKNDTIYISADTIVCLDEKILNKPGNREEAVEMLKLLSGRVHYVITGVCIASGSAFHPFFSKTMVNFTKLDNREIEYYVDKYQPYDKAGSYGIQEWIGYTGVKSIEGSYFNVMGLPVQRLYIELMEFLKK